MGRLTQQPMEKSTKNCRKAWQEERAFDGNEEITALELKNLWKEAYRCDVEGCGNQHIQFKVTQLVFEVVHDV